MTAVTMKLEGVEKALKAFEDLDRRIKRKVTNKAVRAGAKPYLDAVRRKAPTRNRYLRRSMSSVIRTYPNGTVLAVIGQEKAKQFKTTKRTKRGGLSGQGLAVPLHLVEESTRPHTVFGTRASIKVDTTDARGRKRKKTVKIGAVLKPLAWRVGKGRGGQMRFATSVKHPGTQGSHFVRDAAKEAESESVQAFERKFSAEVEAEAAKASKL